MNEYLRVERLHLDALEAFLVEAEIPKLVIRDLETQGLKGPSARSWKAKRVLRPADSLPLSQPWRFEISSGDAGST